MFGVSRPYPFSKASAMNLRSWKLLPSDLSLSVDDSNDETKTYIGGWCVCQPVIDDALLRIFNHPTGTIQSR